MSRRAGPRIERTRATGGDSDDPVEDPREDLPPELRNEDPPEDEPDPDPEEVDPAPREEDDDNDDTGTSIDDITRAADAERFDRTYLAQKEDFQIGGEVASPAPFPLQTLPRLAYVINYNMVYNEDKERWEPKKKEDEVGAGETIDDFEDGGIGEYSGDTGGFTVDQTDPVFSGNVSLKTSSNNQTISSLARLENYPSRGDTFRFHIHLTGSDAGGEMDFGVSDIDSGQYEVQVVPATNNFQVLRFDSPGNFVSIADQDTSIPTGVFLRVRVIWGDPTIACRLSRVDTGAEIAEISGDDTTYDTGGIGWSSTQSQGSDTNVVWDLAELVR